MLTGRKRVGESLYQSIVGKPVSKYERIRRKTGRKVWESENFPPKEDNNNSQKSFILHKQIGKEKR